MGTAMAFQYRMIHYISTAKHCIDMDPYKEPVVFKKKT